MFNFIDVRELLCWGVRSEVLGKPVDETGNLCGVMRGAGIEGEVMGSFRLKS
jgi:hypothetical protein